ncbi:hemoglobin subunit gamma-1-like [Engystomops pustulosus]|uniref:hemoglobin subunit gamma-1-like n=1 Tax=Engystomops pustulosus TaxID=76066 RepID=UPI003AFB6861
MDSFTEKEKKDIEAIWSQVDCERIGKEALVRLLLSHHSTQNCLNSLGNFSSVEEISSNPKVAAHGEKVLQSIGAAMKHLDNLDGHFAEHRQDLGSKLHVDPDNFARFLNVLNVAFARNFPKEYTPEVGATFEKAFSAMKDAFSKAVTK